MRLGGNAATFCNLSIYMIQPMAVGGFFPRVC